MGERREWEDGNNSKRYTAALRMLQTKVRETGNSMAEFPRTVCCLIGAGYSFVAGLPLTKDLFAADVIEASGQAGRRFQAVWDDYDRWHTANPSKNPEEYLAELHANFLSRPGPPFAWAVELVAAVLATLRGADIRPAASRYRMRITEPSPFTAHVDFWSVVTSSFMNVSVVTTNYDLLIERALRHRPMKRAFGPGFYYGGIARPQLLQGTALPFTVTDSQRFVELTGAVSVYKLHGSLNWARQPSRLLLYQDMRPAFRHGGDAAIVPPITDKETPAWLKPIWEEAEQSLAEATCWIVCGYSLPDYDLGMRHLLQCASMKVENIYLLDPFSRDVQAHYHDVAPHATIHRLDGLPHGTQQLRAKLGFARSIGSSRPIDGPNRS